LITKDFFLAFAESTCNPIPKNVSCYIAVAWLIDRRWLERKDLAQYEQHLLSSGFHYLVKKPSQLELNDMAQLYPHRNPFFYYICGFAFPSIDWAFTPLDCLFTALAIQLSSKAIATTIRGYEATAFQVTDTSLLALVYGYVDVARQLRDTSRNKPRDQVMIHLQYCCKIGQLASLTIEQVRLLIDWYPIELYKDLRFLRNEAFYEHLNSVELRPEVLQLLENQWKNLHDPKRKQ
jgi:hypothetical protein